ncbi:MAG: hypothetical protein QOJ42_1733 [Acidobacteriaceae bacterium]|jgi:hypothetical protein|nr:hypothetical protein [Acidobacteriaceae bacterium]
MRHHAAMLGLPVSLVTARCGRTPEACARADVRGLGRSGNGEPRMISYLDSLHASPMVGYAKQAPRPTADYPAVLNKRFLTILVSDRNKHIFGSNRHEVIGVARIFRN